MDQNDNKQDLEWNAIFAENLIREREKSGLTAEEMAERLNVTGSHYRKLEQGKGYFPSVTVLIKIWMTLNCARESLFDGIVDWDELREFYKLKETYKSINPEDMKRANAVLDALFRDL